MPVATARVRSGAEGRSELRARLESRRPEIEAAISTRIGAIADPAGPADPAYVEGLRGAVGAALDYGLSALDALEGRELPIPVALLAQARFAARNGIALDTVLRRYFAGYSLLGWFMVEEAGDGVLRGGELQRLIGAQATAFDRLVEEIAEEHARERAALASSSVQAQHVERLLAGEPVEPSGIAYDLSLTHLAAIASGSAAEGVLRRLAASFDQRLLLHPRPEGVTWAWLGSRAGLDPAALSAWVDGEMPETALTLAFGEPARGLRGWRLTHRQALAAHAVATHTRSRATRYVDVALLAAALQDDLLATSLRKLYLDPLETGGDGGRTLRETLRAYFASGCNSASASSLIGVTRQTVNNRLRAAEGLLGRYLRADSKELEVALQLDAFRDSSAEPCHERETPPFPAAK